jgi:ADP-ribosyl-[dinitrogen reductase] hydrolase
MTHDNQGICGTLSQGKDRMSQSLDQEQTRQHFQDRISGILVGAACGDALGAGYEFGPALDPSTPVRMRGQGAFAAGEWTDDTAQMIAIALAAEKYDINIPAGQNEIARNFVEWYNSPAREKDIGIHTAHVLSQLASVDQRDLAGKATQIAFDKERANPNSSGGNGALMRTAAVVLAKHDNEAELVKTAIEIAELTHADERSTQASVLWCLAIKCAIDISSFTGEKHLQQLQENLEKAIDRTMPKHATYWKQQLKDATGKDPRTFTSNNGYSVQTLKCAWAAITHTPISIHSPTDHFREALEEAVRAGNDADTVACVAGALLGAMWGMGAMPVDWLGQIHGWPDMNFETLINLSVNTCRFNRFNRYS